jgi:hypothetical protein
MNSPYEGLPQRGFWKTAVTNRPPLDPGDLYQPKFAITPEMRIVTAGSCFAQHVGRALRGAGLKVIDTEPLPKRVPDELAHEYGYRLYSARYGNIYTMRQLKQLALEARGKFSPAEQVWKRGNRYYDSQRPNIEPNGLDSEASVLRHRKVHLRLVNRAFKRADLFVFTFGLTEAWIHTETGTVYPTAPGTIAGEYDADIFSFKNYNVAEVINDFYEFRSLIKESNPNVRFLITVSPVPLTATATSDHVEVATCYSKSVLRAACGHLNTQFDDVDYFPSYEVITSLNSRGCYYEENKRSISPDGVSKVMNMLLGKHNLNGAPRKQEFGESKVKAVIGENLSAESDEVCEDVLLEAFAR